MKSENEPKTERLHLRVTKSVYEQIREGAYQSRMSMSEYIASLAIKKKIYVIPQLMQYLYQVSKIGANVNQVTIAVHQQKAITQTQLDILNENLIAVQNEIRNLIATVVDAKDDDEWHTSGNGQ